MDKLLGKTALITGGSSGIGLAMAKQLAGMGANIWIMARDPLKLEKACNEIMACRQTPDQRVLTIAADVSNLDQVSQGLTPLVTEQGVPDILVNSAGITYPGYFQDIDLQIFRDMMDVNFYGTLYTTRLLVPGMIERRSGRIINIASLIALRASPAYSAYCASKFAVVGLSDAIRYDLKPYGIQVSLVFPTDTMTPGLEIERSQQPAEIHALLSGHNTAASPELVARNILKAAFKSRYFIFPTTDARLLYAIISLLPGESLYKLIDLWISQARNQVTKNNRSQ